MPVIYNRTIWRNRVVQRPRTYEEETNLDGSVTHTPAPGTVLQEGTPLNEDNLNHMEAGIAATAAAINALEAEEASLNGRVSAHTGNMSNPHRVSAAQIGAATSARVAALEAQLTDALTRLQTLENPTVRKQALALENGWTVWHTYPEETLRVVRRGETVFLQGVIENTKKITSLGTAALKVATLPTWARPARLVDMVCQGSSRAIFLLCARPNGDLDVQRYRVGDSYPEIAAGSMFAMTAQWAAADAIGEGQSD